MKIKLILLLFLVTGFSLCKAQQGDYNRGLIYLDEDGEESMLFMDVVVNNYNNNPVSAVGVDRTERVFYYSSSHRYGETLYLMSAFHQIAAIEYSEYFIFDSFQNFIRYVYVCDDVKLDYKIDGQNVSTVVEQNSEKFADNYFLFEPENYFTFEAIRKRCNAEFKHCTSVTGILNYELEVLKIRELYKSINSDKTLRAENVDDVTKYYRLDELVKIVIVTEATYEFYFDNGSMFFAFVNGDNDIPEQRLYLSHSRPFKLIYGKNNLPKENDEFWDYSDSILRVYRDYISTE
jgi:hypothetical protein